MNREFIDAIESLEKEKEISKEVLLEAIESALVSAYKKNYGTTQNVCVDIDNETGDISVYTQKTIVDTVEDEMNEISLDDAREIFSSYEIGDVVNYQVTPKDFGRIAAQTAKQVVVQRIREAERGMIFDDYINRRGEIINGTVQRISNETIFVNMGKAEGILAASERVKGEKFKVNDRIRVYVMDVKKTTKGPQVFLSRSHPGLVKKLFELEVPEIEDGIVEIRSIAREAGSRTKIAVWTDDENVDSVGACVGARGSRVQNVVDELFGEKIDIIVWSEDPAQLIKNVLSPAQVEEVFLDEDEKLASVVVPDYQLSLAIGKEGQNVRLAAKLCGWKIDIKSHSQYYENMPEKDDPEDNDTAEKDITDDVSGSNNSEEYDTTEETVEEVTEETADEATEEVNEKTTEETAKEAIEETVAEAAEEMAVNEEKTEVEEKTEEIETEETEIEETESQSE